MMSHYDVECPYCGHEYDICNDDGWACEEDTRYEEECPSCEKLFVIYPSWEVYYSVRKTECLNGDAEHDWHKIPFFQTLKVDHYRCNVCGIEKHGRHYTNDEFNKVFIDKPRLTEEEIFGNGKEEQR